MTNNTPTFPSPSNVASPTHFPAPFMPAPAMPAPAMPAPTMPAPVMPGPGPAPVVATHGRRRVGSIVAGVAVVIVSVVGLGVQQGNSRSATAADGPSSQQPAPVDTSVPSPDGMPDLSTPSAPPAPAPLDTDPAGPTDTAASGPAVVLPSTTAPATTEPATTAPATTTPATTTPATTVPQPAAHSLAALTVGSCVLDGAPVECQRGVEVVTHVAATGDECANGETKLTVTESASVPQVVVVCLLPWSLDDRSFAQAFTLDANCGPQSADDILTHEIDGLACTDAAGTDYFLVKVAEGQIMPYLTDVLGATFVGDFTIEGGVVCGAHYQVGEWDVWVYGYGPFVEFRPLGDTGSVRFSPSLCAA